VDGACLRRTYAPIRAPVPLVKHRKVSFPFPPTRFFLGKENPKYSCNTCLAVILRKWPYGHAAGCDGRRRLPRRRGAECQQMVTASDVLGMVLGRPHRVYRSRFVGSARVALVSYSDHSYINAFVDAVQFI
jgi:hypothetical protein